MAIRATRKNSSNKFLLTLHLTGQNCKKIPGNPFIFGSDKNRVLWNEIESSQQKCHSREGGNPAGLSVFSGFLLAHERQPLPSIYLFKHQKVLADLIVQDLQCLVRNDPVMVDIS